MPKFTFLILAFLMLNKRSKAQCLLDKSNYEIVWNDEFNYANNNASLLSSKWLPYFSYQSSANLTIDVNDCDRYIWDSTNLKLSTDASGNGFLTISARKLLPPKLINSVSYPYSSSMVLSKSDIDCSGGWEPYGFQYGIFEIRCKLAPAGAGLSAFWLAGNGFEIDMFEAAKDKGGNKWKFFSTVHGPSLTSGIGCSTFYDWLFGDPSADFHIYTLVWIKDKVTFFIDGMEIRTSTLKPLNNNYCYGQKMSLIASVHPHCWDSYGYNTMTGKMKDGMVIDYIRVYKPKQYPGMPLPANYQFPLYKTSETFNNTNVSNITGQNVDFFGSIAATTTLKSTIYERLFYANFNGVISYFENNSNSNTWLHINTNIVNCGSGSTFTSDTLSNNIFYRGKDNEIWTAGYWSGSLSASSLDAYSLYPNNVATNSRLVYTQNPNPRVYFKNTSNSICYYEYKISTSPQWLRYTTNINISSNEMATNSTGNGIYYVGNDNEIWTYYTDFNNANINICMDMYNLYPNDVSRGIVANGSRIYYINNANSVSFFEFITSTLHWQKFSTTTTNVKSNIISRNSNQGFFYISTDNDVYTYHYYNGSWVNHKINFLLSDRKAFGFLTKSIANSDRLYYIDTEAKLRYWEWGSCEVLDPLCTTFEDAQGIGLKGLNTNHNELLSSPSKHAPTFLSNGRESVPNDNIGETAEEMNFILYPNPFDQFLTIENVKLSKKEVFTISIFNIAGQKILDRIFENKIRLDLSDLVRGTYITIIYDSQFHQLQRNLIAK